jgi:hypothetical protein
MAICLVIDNVTNVIVNRIVADLDEVSPDGTRLMLWTEDMYCDIGWTWTENGFVAPPVTEVGAE